MKRKNHIRRKTDIFLSGLLVLSFAGCAAFSALEDVEKTYFSVLSGEAPLLYTEEGEEVSLDLDRVPAVFSRESDYSSIWRFTAVDLDGDGETEVLLQVIDVAGDMGGYMILHREAEEVYGYSASYRDFEDLKTDGTYSCTHPAGTAVSVCRSCFDGGSCLTEPLICSSTENGWETAAYFIKGQPASEEEYLAAIERQAAKPDAVWRPFDEKNIREMFA